jgi:hypothetical protein
MSHVTTIKAQILDLEVLKAACHDLGLEFREGQQTYRWYGTHVGDYPLPEGFTKNDLGKCLHAIGIPGNKNAYEIGVVVRRDGQPGYTLMWDFWAGGHGLQAVVGNDCKKLVQAYATNKAIKSLKKKGYAVKRVVSKKTNKIRLIATRP